MGGNPYAPDAETTLQYLNKSAFAKVPIGQGGAPLHLGTIV